VNPVKLLDHHSSVDAPPAMGWLNSDPRNSASRHSRASGHSHLESVGGRSPNEAFALESGKRPVSLNQPVAVGQIGVRSVATEAPTFRSDKVVNFLLSHRTEFDIHGLCASF
jgi:hypothetical protein